MGQLVLEFVEFFLCFRLKCCSCYRTGDGNTARYSLNNTMNRITDITDLVADSSEESDEETIVGSQSHMKLELGLRRRGKQRNQSNAGTAGDARCMIWCRRATVFTSLVAIIVAAGVIIMHVVSNNNPHEGERVAMESHRIAQQQQLLEIAERVAMACSEHNLNDDISDCQNLCHSNMCCFATGFYSCEKDENINCAVYAGCEALR